LERRTQKSRISGNKDSDNFERRTVAPLRALDHYKENMYFTKIDEADFAIKPMNCPGACWYTRESFIPTGICLRGWRSLSGAQARAFRSFARLNEVRCFTQDDAHIFMTPDQIESEILGVYKSD